MRSSPGSSRSMTSPRDTRSRIPSPFGLTLNIVMLLGRFRFARLPAHPSAIHDQNVSMYVVARLRAQKDRGPRDVCGLAPTASRYPLQNLSVARRIALEGGGVVRSHVARRNGIDVDALRGPLVGEGLRE